MTTQVKSQRFRLRRATPANASTEGSSVAPRVPPQGGTPATTDVPGPAYTLRRKPKTDGVRAPADPERPDPAPPQDETRDYGQAEPATTGFTAKDHAQSVAPRQHDTSEHPHMADAEGSASALDEIEAIRAEGMTARQLRMAMRVAQKHGIRATSAFEAVLMLRKRGIDPFARSTMLDLVRSEPATMMGRELAPRPATEVAPGGAPPPNPIEDAKERMARLAAEREREVKRVQRDIARRRRKRLVLLGARLLVFVSLPTFIASWYFYMIATPMYATESQFIIQQADGNAGAGDLAGMLPSAAGMGLGGQSEAASVQSFLQSRPAMLRLDREEGFRAHFQQDNIDLIRRLPPDASDEATFKTYKRHVKIGYDPTEGVVRMEVLAADPADSERFARALIRYAEEHVDMMTQRLRDSQMREARENLDEAQQRLIDARLVVVEFQEQSSLFSGEVELSLISQQIGALEAELSQTRLSLQELRSNIRPNPARLQPLERREAALRDQIEDLRSSMTRDSAGSTSLARTQSQLIMAEAEVQTREMMRAQAMQQMESARIEVSRQVRYLALSVEPVASDEPAYPRRFEYSALAFLIFLGIYLFGSMTGSVLREQVSG